MPKIRAAQLNMAIVDNEKLQKYEEEVKVLMKQTAFNVIRIGEILTDVKENILPKNWQKWVDKTFEGQFSHDSAVNFMNAAKLFQDYGGQYKEGFENLSLRVLYQIGRGNVEKPVKETILQLASEQEPLSNDEAKMVTRLYKKLKLVQAGVDSDAIKKLEGSDTLDNPNEIEALGRLSRPKRDAVINLLSKGSADTVKHALKAIKKEREDVIEALVSETEVGGFEEINFKGFSRIQEESVNAAFIEAPLKSQFVETDLKKLSKELDRVLAPGGYAIITLGHKGIFFAGAELEPLKPLHVLCLRRQPGRTRSLVGANILSASVLAAFCYKPPYRQPTSMLVDLQTYVDEVEGNTMTTSETVVGFDEVPTGLEECVCRFLHPLINNEDTVLHGILTSQHFNLGDTIKTKAKDRHASRLITVQQY